MDIQTNPSAIATPAPIAGSDTAQSATISSDFETFLKMLTAQMENQDPLNPLDSQDFATQLATFSGVEQQVKTNDLLKALSTNLGVSGLSDMAGWIGREARIAAPAPFDGSPIEVLPDPPISADSATLVVRNSAGHEVQRVPIAASDAPIVWQGVATNGLTFPNDTYEFTVEAVADGEVISTSTPEVFLAVREIRAVDGQTMIVLSNGDLLPSQNVTGLR